MVENSCEYKRRENGKVIEPGQTICSSSIITLQGNPYTESNDYLASIRNTFGDIRRREEDKVEMLEN